MPALSLRLREAIAASHAAIEATPLAMAMQTGTLSRAGYTPLLQQTWRLHAGTEPACHHAARAFAPLRALCTPDGDRRHVLLEDLRVLAASPDVAPHQAIVALVARTQRQSWNTPWALAGLLYVLEGSRLGSSVIARALAAGWNVPVQCGIGLDYHLHGSEQRGPRWTAVRRSLDALPLTLAQATDAVRCAQQAMDDLGRLYTDLAPRETHRAEAPWAPASA